MAAPLDPDPLPYFLAECSCNAYEDGKALRDIYTGSSIRWALVSFVEDPGTDTQAFVLHSLDPQQQARIVVAFRGTTLFSLLDLWSDIKSFTPADFPNRLVSGAKVGKGFLDAWRSVEAGVKRVIDDLLSRNTYSQILVTGHSLGAAIATLAFVDLQAYYSAKPIAVYTFASPVVGNAAFASIVAALIRNPIYTSFHYMDSNDFLVFVNSFFESSYWTTPFVPVVNQMSTWPGNGHSILNYMAKLRFEPSTAKLSAGLPQLPTDYVITRLVVRTFTSDILYYQNVPNPIIRVYLKVGVAADGSGGVEFQLVPSGGVTPFRRDQFDVFVINITGRFLGVLDFAHCKIRAEVQGRWNLAGLQILANGAPLFTNTNLYREFDAKNTEWLFPVPGASSYRCRLHCLGTSPGSTWLNGQTGPGKVDLVKTPEGYIGANWELRYAAPGQVFIYCLGDIPGSSYLNGITTSGSVDLVSNVQGHSGTSWQTLAREGGGVAFKCKGQSGERYLNGVTTEAKVNLKDNTSRHSGTAWQIAGIA